MKLEWQDAPTQTQWGHDMVVATVALGKDHSVDLYCARSKIAETESLLKKPWVPLTNEEIAEFDTWHDNREEEVGWVPPSEIVAYIDAKLKEKNEFHIKN